MGALPTPVTESGQQGAPPRPPQSSCAAGLARGQESARDWLSSPGRRNQHPPRPGRLLSLLSRKESGQKPFSNQIFT